MIKLYFLSNSQLKYTQIGRAYLIAAIILPIILSVSATICIVRFGSNLFGVERILTERMAGKNKTLEVRLEVLSQEIQKLRNSMGNLNNSDDQIRTAVSLPPITNDERRASIGGVELNVDYGLSTVEDSLIAGSVGTINLLERESKLLRLSHAQINAKRASNEEMFRHIPAINPVRGGVVIDKFGMRFHPILHALLMHEGIDLAAKLGTPVYSTGDGIVSYVGRRGGYGLVVEIDNGFGYTTLFAHLEKALVMEGEKVRRGQEIAYVGDTGLSTGPHLHYGITKDGIYVDPELYFFPESEPEIDSLYDSKSDN